MRFQLLAARSALVLLALAALTAAGAVGGVRLGLMPFEHGLTLMTAAVAFGLLALALALAWTITAFRHNRGEGKRAGLTALIGAVFLLTPPLHTAYMGLTSPPIHDAATDPEDPPQFVALA
ncbi:MAG TPA: hypothetical protein VG501_03535, partial [Rhizomicrobium sp.]|nr:hypothetical protein [Rhizomicrobium sp.]